MISTPRTLNIATRYNPDLGLPLDSTIDVPTIEYATTFVTLPHAKGSVGPLTLTQKDDKSTWKPSLVDTTFVNGDLQVGCLLFGVGIAIDADPITFAVEGRYNSRPATLDYEAGWKFIGDLLDGTRFRVIAGQRVFLVDEALDDVAHVDASLNLGSRASGPSDVSEFVRRTNKHIGADRFVSEARLVMLSSVAHRFRTASRGLIEFKKPIFIEAGTRISADLVPIGDDLEFPCIRMDDDRYSIPAGKVRIRFTLRGFEVWGAEWRDKFIANPDVTKLQL